MYSIISKQSCCVIVSSLSLLYYPFRAQEVFRQAMHSPTVRLEVVPSSKRDRYEKTHSTDSSPHFTKAKDPPPPFKAKPMRMAEEIASMESAVSVSCSVCAYYRHLFFLS